MDERVHGSRGSPNLSMSSSVRSSASSSALMRRYAVEVQPLPGERTYSPEYWRIRRGRLRTPRGHGLFAALLQNRLLQEFKIHVVAHVYHVARLLRPEQVARASYFQVAHGDLYAGVELRELRMADRRFSAVSVSALSRRKVRYALAFREDLPTLPLIWWSRARPSLSASSIIRVFTSDVYAVSMIVVQTSTCTSPWTIFSITSVSASSSSGRGRRRQRRF